MHHRVLPLAAGAAWLSAASSPASAAAYSTYGASYDTFTPPPFGGMGGVGSFGTLGDNLADGRLIAVTGNTVYAETAPGSRDFQPVATFDTAFSAGTVDPAFVRISPDGSRIAVGMGFGKPVAVFDASTLGTPGMPVALTGANTSYFDIPHYDAAWRNSSELAVNYGVSGFTAAVSLLDVNSPVAAPINPTIITNIGGASTGIAFDSRGNLYTGNGFDAAPGGSDTGHIRAFTPADWSGSAADFETDGTHIADTLSAVSLVFDTDGNLFVGGGDFGASFDAGYLGVISADALADAWLGSPIDNSDLNDLRMLDPLGTGFGFFVSAFNDATGELIIIDNDFTTGVSTWHATIPAPHGITLLLLVASPRRRR